MLRRPGHAWPLLIAANRDEMRHRPWRAPGRHWPDRPETVGGLDELANGSWLAANDWGVVAGALNRPGTLGPARGARSRGELVLDATDCAEAADAAQMLSALDARAYRPFNLVVADDRDAFVAWGLGADGPPAPAIRRLPEGLSTISALGANDIAGSARQRFYRPRFERAPTPDPESGDWTAWEALLACRETEAGAGPEGAMNIVTATGFGTVSSSLIALPAQGRAMPPVWRFGHGHPDAIVYDPVTF